MAGRLERCNSCKVQLIVPPEAKTVRCVVCQSVIRVQSDEHQTASRLKGFLNSVSGNINSLVNKPVYSYFLQPAGPPTLFSLSSAHGRKRAVLCGVSYHGQRCRLKGSVNDVRCMKYFLVEKMHFPNDSILVLTEEENDFSRIPTKQNMRRALQWLVQGCRSGDSLVFHYSGHGLQQRDLNGDEVDGFDEVLLPVDYATEGAILDDEINAAIVRPLPRGAKLHAVVDACHSGTILDLPFVCKMDRNGYHWEDHSRLTSTYNGTNGGIALSITACDDHKLAFDTTALSGYTSTGALTYCFIQAAQNEPGLSYGRLLRAMRNAIWEARNGHRGPIASLMRKLINPDFPQEPQLSSTEKFDIYTQPFSF